MKIQFLLWSPDSPLILAFQQLLSGDIDGFLVKF